MSKREMERYHSIRQQQEEDLRKRLDEAKKDENWELFVETYHKISMFEYRSDNMSEDAHILALWDFRREVLSRVDLGKTEKKDVS